MKTISIVINVDTRPGFLKKEGSLQPGEGGTKSTDFFIEGVQNKIAFFEGAGYDIETTVSVDLHERLPQFIWDEYEGWDQIDNLLIAKHSVKYPGFEHFPKWLDLNILNALTLSRGDYLVHFDQDMAAFINDKTVIDQWIEWLDSEKYDYISYPSAHSPGPCWDPDFNDDYWWASTRFFFCKRDILDYSEIMRCLNSSEYLYGKYGEKNRQCPWLEHIISIIRGQGRVFYPPHQSEKYMIFSWKSYRSGLLSDLNQMSYAEVRDRVIKSGGVGYPCDVNGVAI